MDPWIEVVQVELEYTDLSLVYREREREREIDLLHAGFSLTTLYCTGKKPDLVHAES